MQVFYMFICAFYAFFMLRFFFQKTLFCKYCIVWSVSALIFFNGQKQILPQSATVETLNKMKHFMLADHKVNKAQLNIL